MNSFLKSAHACNTSTINFTCKMLQMIQWTAYKLIPKWLLHDKHVKSMQVYSIISLQNYSESAMYSGTWRIAGTLWISVPITEVSWISRVATCMSLKQYHICIKFSDHNLWYSVNIGVLIQNSNCPQLHVDFTVSWS
jgi:hypothetical protein